MFCKKEDISRPYQPDRLFRPLTDFSIGSSIYTTKFSRLAQVDLGKGCSTRFRALKRSFRKKLPQTYKVSKISESGATKKSDTV